MNYNLEMKSIINNLEKGHNKLLLHSCCAPCSSSVIEQIKNYFDITVLYYNPNIEPQEEYQKRKSEQKKLLKELNIKYYEIDYLNEEFKNKIIGYENEPENGFRCHLCYELRLEKTAEIAKEKNYDYFGTTLTVSPYKSSKIINEIGSKLAEKYQIKYLFSDFKKENGYQRSIELSKKYNLYRQNYCGCLYSRKENEE
ncbi:MAG: epoxyqueuosine reductase QueH [Mollicutes bacterium]|nr:epoxyqueuosine reductase QueH [Mollicutes bacterium]